MNSGLITTIIVFLVLIILLTLADYYSTYAWENMVVFDQNEKNAQTWLYDAWIIGYVTLGVVLIFAIVALVFGFKQKGYSEEASNEDNMTTQKKNNKTLRIISWFILIPFFLILASGILVALAENNIRNGPSWSQNQFVYYSLIWSDVIYFVIGIYLLFLLFVWPPMVLNVFTPPQEEEVCTMQEKDE